MSPTAMLFIDGENLLIRFEAMLSNGRKPVVDIMHAPGEFVWAPNFAQYKDLEITRASYYTTHVGDDLTQRNLEESLAKLPWHCHRTRVSGSMNPHVFRKSKKSQKTASVDINIAIDVLRHCYQKDVGAVYIVAGDGDYIPLIKEAMRTGTRVFVGALSDGLNSALPIVPDSFDLLDRVFFQPAN
jgi:uncharacterized LabA/DUF88 family protein